MINFTPTYLYIKQHNISGKLYFGKTTKNPETYLGSGTHWRRHINKHSKEHIETLWYCLFFDQETISEFALMFSEQQNIVESRDWLNKIPENGLDGCPAGISRGPHSEEHKLKLSIAHKGKPHSEETKLKLSISNKGKPKSEETKLKMSIAHKGKSQGPHSEEHKLKLSIAKKGVPKSKEHKLNISIAKKGSKQPVVTCPHCNKSGANTMKRWYFDNCFYKENTKGNNNEN